MIMINHVTGMNIYAINPRKRVIVEHGDVTKQAIIAIKSSKLVVRRCNILGGIIASMSWVQIVCMNNSHDIAQA